MINGSSVTYNIIVVADAVTANVNITCTQIIDTDIEIVMPILVHVSAYVAADISAQRYSEHQC
jgi:hypothetical protein